MEPNEIRIKILNFIRFTGPGLPVNISKGCGMPTLITSAYLAEMSDNKQVKISTLKYGGSPLYYLPGQEASLENFISHLNPHDRDIFLKLKERQILEDSKEEPVHRVGLRSIKDFAFPLRIVQDGQEKLFWRIYSISDQEALEKIRQLLEPKKEEKIEKEKLEKPAEKLEVKEEKKAEKARHARKKKEKKEENAEAKAEEKKARRKPFDIREWLSKNNILISQEIASRPKESSFTASVPSNLGNLEFYTVFKDKKSISEAEIVMAYHLSQDSKLPLFFITTGKLSKKADGYANNLKIVFKQIG
jgi:hypothetical protein